MITNFKDFYEVIDPDFDMAYEMYESLRGKYNYGPFVFEPKGDNYYFKEQCSGEHMILTEESRIAFMKYLSKKWEQDGLGIEEYKNYLDMCNKDD